MKSSKYFYFTKYNSGRDKSIYIFLNKFDRFPFTNTNSQFVPFLIANTSQMLFKSQRLFENTKHKDVLKHTQGI